MVLSHSTCQEISAVSPDNIKKLLFCIDKEETYNYNLVKVHH